MAAFGPPTRIDSLFYIALRKDLHALHEQK
jgi:hypothetical protein